MVAATKMRRAQLQALRGRAYALLAWDMLNALAKKVQLTRHALLQERDSVRHMTIVVISSNRGLAGSFNSNIANAALRFIENTKQKYPTVEIEIIAVGGKAGREMAKAGFTVAAQFGKTDVDVRVSDILPLAKLLIDKFMNQETDLVAVAYTDFVSTLKQYARTKQVLPFPKLISAEELALRDDLGKVILEDRAAGIAEYQQEREFGYGYIFEPSPDSVLSKLIPRIIEMQLYQTLLESNASEHSARMIAMKNASDAASDLIDDYTLLYNQMRQAAITREIAEISAGRLAVAH